MRTLTATELERMRSTQESSYQDACVLLRYSSDDAGDFNLGDDDWADDPDGEIACGFAPARSKEVQEEGEVVIKPAMLRLPVDTTIDRRDRVRLTKRHGEALAESVEYEIVGEPQRGPSGLVLGLQKVTD